MPRPKGEDALASLQASDWLALRSSGMTYAAIAIKAQDPLTGKGPSSETVRRRVTKYLEEHPAQNADEYRQIQLAGYDRLLRALSPGVDEGDTRSVAETRKILEAQARLLGLNAATKAEITVEHKEDPAILQKIKAQRLANEQQRAALAESLQAAPLALPSPLDVQDAEVVEES